MIHRLLIIGVAGLIGTLARYGLTSLVARRLGDTFPVGTLVVNIVGCFLAGFLFYLLNERITVSEVARTAILFGFLGGFTTFSAYGLQTINLFREGSMTLALVYILLSNIVGLATVWMGYSIARFI